jgi:hypothetical protein
MIAFVDPWRADAARWLERSPMPPLWQYFSRLLTNQVTSAYLETDGTSRFTAAELLALNEAEAQSKLSEAEGLLRAELENGPRPVTELRAAALELGISITTLERAKKRLGARSVKLDLDRWAWALSEAEASEDEAAAA